MSVTSDLMAQLRHKLMSHSDVALLDHHGQLALPKAVTTQYGEKMSEHTTALIGIGHVGTRYATKVTLQFQAELAVAHAAVAKELPDDFFSQNNFLSLRSRVQNHREYLLRPDLGRRLDEPSLQMLRQQAKKQIDVQPILADGLSAVACLGSGVLLYQKFVAECQTLGLTVGDPMGARFARVWLEDEIGQEVAAKVAVIILGERPGLGTGDGLSAYMVHNPQIGNTDGNRNMISNIHPRGMLPELAAKRLARLAQVMILTKSSGVELDLTKFADLSSLATGYRSGQKREWLVTTPQEGLT